MHLVYWSCIFNCTLWQVLFQGCTNHGSSGLVYSIVHCGRYFSKVVPITAVSLSESNCIQIYKKENSSQFHNLNISLFQYETKHEGLLPVTGYWSPSLRMLRMLFLNIQTGSMCNNTELSRGWKSATLIHFPPSLERTEIVEPVFIRFDQSISCSL